MRVSSEEQAAINECISHSKRFGFGNVISHLFTAWRITLMEKGRFTTKEAVSGAWGNSRVSQIDMPIKMHKDIIENGEWDETGGKYL